MKLSRKTLTIGVITLVLVGGGVWWMMTPSTPQYVLVDVVRGSIAQEVFVTGTTKPVQSVDLSFERSGRVKAVYFDTGARVVAGDVIAELDAQELNAQMAQARAGVQAASAQRTQLLAGLNAQMAKLDQLYKGATPEQIRVGQDGVSSAQNGLDNARTALQNAQTLADSQRAQAATAVAQAEITLQDTIAKTSLDLANLYDGTGDVMRSVVVNAASAINETDVMFVEGTGGQRPSLAFYTTDTQVRDAAEQGRINAKSAYTRLKNASDGFSGSRYDTVDQMLSTTKSDLGVIQSFLSTVGKAIDGGNLSLSTASSYKSAVARGQSAVAGAISSANSREYAIKAQRQTGESSVNAARTQLTNAKAAQVSQEASSTSSLEAARARVKDMEHALESARGQLSLTTASSTSEVIRAQQAAVDQARAQVVSQEAQMQSAQSNVEFYESQLAKTKIVAPMDGVITKQDAKLGQLAGANASLVSLMSDMKFEIEANVPEVDIERMALGQPVHVTFDAILGQEFTGKVAHIDPAETVIGGVVSFRIRVMLDNGVDVVRSGMTANLSIEALKKEGVLIVPQVGVIENEQGTFVRVLEGGVTRELPITPGVRSHNGDVEVLEGLKEGDRVINVSVRK